MESVGSVIAQTSPQWELIVVDDGSQVPVTLDLIDQHQFASKIKIIRHPQAQGLSSARNSGVAAASGNYVTFLDDDDYLSNEAIGIISRALNQLNEPECLFLKIEPFGPLAAGTKENQETALDKVLQDINIAKESRQSLIPDNRALFVALLKRLPMTFQRPVVRKDAFQEKTGGYEGRSFGDLEWNYRATLRCQCGILLEPVYQVRCQGQSYFSKSDAKAAMLDTIIKIRKNLLLLPEVQSNASLTREVKKALSLAYFEKSYHAYSENLPFPWKDFWRASSGGIRWSHFSLLTKTLKKYILTREIR